MISKLVETIEDRLSRGIFFIKYLLQMEHCNWEVYETAVKKNLMENSVGNIELFYMKI